MMYTIVAIIRPHLLDPVRDALHDLDLLGFTASDCRGEGRQKSVAHTFRGSQYGHNLEPRIRIEVAVTGADLDSAVDAVQKAASTGEVGDGKIFVYQIHDVVRIRTNERGEPALS